MDHEIVKLSDYSFPIENEISLLREKGLITIKVDVRIVWRSWRKIRILFDFALNDVISYHHYTKEYEAEFKKLFDEELIVFENTLFTKPESDFISYILNKEKFSDGYDVRNKCEHGTQANSKMKIKEHKEYFFLALLIVTICMIKIVDDLTLNDGN